jgi:GT2 family glycosyltransferase
VRIAAVIVNHNGGEDVARCLSALQAQTIAIEVVLVDCASSDSSRSFAQSPSPGLVGVPLTENLGFAGGCNAGLAALTAPTDAVAFLNPDCFPAPDFFEVCRDLLERHPDVGGVAGRLERPGGELLDSCGQVLTGTLLRVRDRGYGRPGHGVYLEGTDVLAGCGAAMVYRTAALDAAAIAGRALPDEFFAFWEDLDLGWRVNNRGWRVVYAPNARAVHRRGATAAPGKGRLVFRRAPRLAACILANRWATFARNLHTLDFLLHLPLLLPFEVLAVLAVLVRRPAVLPALWRALPRVRKALEQRRALPQRRLRELPWR